MELYLCSPCMLSLCGQEKLCLYQICTKVLLKYLYPTMQFALPCNTFTGVCFILRISRFPYTIFFSVALQVVFGEDEKGFAHHVMGIVHDAASYLPDLLEHMAENYPSLTVKNGVLGRNSDIETTTMKQYRDQVIPLVYIEMGKKFGYS